MKKINVLIIEDHQIIIKIYKEALNRIRENFENTDFKIEEAKDCETVLNKLKLVTLKNTYDLIFLDIQIPPLSDNTILTGENLGVKIKQIMPNTKIIVCTSLSDSLRLSNIIKTINPIGFLIKSDIDFKDIIIAIEKIIVCKEPYYSKTIINLLRTKESCSIRLDVLDFQILKEISNGASMKELNELISLSRASIEKRKRLLKDKFEVKNNSDRNLILSAREKGFI